MSQYALDLFITFGTVLHDLFDFYVISEVADMCTYTFIHSLTIFRYVLWRGTLLFAFIIVFGNILIAFKLGPEHRRRWLAWRMGKYGVPGQDGVVLVH